MPKRPTEVMLPTLLKSTLACFALAAALTQAAAWDVSAAEQENAGERAPVESTSATETTADAKNLPNPATPAKKWVSAYYVGYGQYLQKPSQVDYASLTHLVVGIVTFNANMVMNLNDFPSVTNVAALVSNAHKAGRKAILMVGGEGMSPIAWRSLTSGSQAASFATKLVGLATRYGFDGFDLDWEPLDTSDYPLLSSLITEIRNQMNCEISIAVAPKGIRDFVPRTFASLAAQVDQVNLMTYGMSGAWYGWKSWHSSPLSGAGSDHPIDVTTSINAYLRAGVPAAQLGVGIGSFGTCWVAPVNAPLQSLAELSSANATTFISFADIVNQYQPAMTRNFDRIAQVPYLSANAPHGRNACQFISYEDEESVAAKASFVANHGLGGAIIWNLNQQYNRTAVEPNSLAKAVGRAFL